MADENVLTGTPQTTEDAATPDAVALEELKAAHQRELDSWKSKHEELSRDRGNLLNQATTLKRQLDAKQSYGAEIPRYTTSVPEEAVTQNVAALEGELKGMRFFQHAQRSKGVDLSDPTLRPLLVQAENEAVRELQIHGLDPADRANETRLFDEVVAQVEKNRLYQAYRVTEQESKKPDNISATEVTATGVTGGRSASDGGITPSKEEAALKRAKDIMDKIYPESSGRRKPNPF